MGSQGGAGDSWWDEVYTGPGDDLPDTPRADSRQGTVDDWFDAVSGLLGPDASGAAEPGDAGSTGGPPTVVEGATRPPRVPPFPSPREAPAPASASAVDGWEDLLDDPLSSPVTRPPARDVPGAPGGDDRPLSSPTRNLRPPARPAPDAPGDDSPRPPVRAVPDAPGDDSPRSPARDAPDAPGGDSPRSPARDVPDGDDWPSRRDLSSLTRDLRPPTRAVPDEPGDVSPRSPARAVPDAPGDVSPRSPARAVPDAPGGDSPRSPARDVPDGDDWPSRRDLSSLTRDLRPPTRAVPDAPGDASPRPPTRDVPDAPGGDSPRSPARAVPDEPGDDDTLPTRDVADAPGEDDRPQPRDLSSPTRNLRPPAREVPGADEGASPRDDLRSPAGEGDAERSLPPLPVRPPRIPALRPDPRLSPPPAPAPTPAEASQRAEQEAPATGPYPESPPDPVESPWPEWPADPVGTPAASAPAPARPAMPPAEATPPAPTPARPTVPLPAEGTTPAPARPAVPPRAEATPPARPAVSPPAEGTTPAGPASPPPAEGTVLLPHVGERPPTYDPEPTALPLADPDLLGALVPDTVLDGARYGTMTLRATSVRGDSARYRGENRADRLLTARFGEGADALLVVVIATPAASDEPSVAEDACRQLAAAIGRSRAELLGDLRTGAQENLRYGLQRLTARATVRLRGAYAGPGVADPGAENSGALHALIAPLDPTSRLRAGFGVGPGTLLLLGDAAWYDAYAGRRLAQPQASTEPKPDDGRFRFRVVVPEPGDVLLLCSDGLAQPLREEPAVSDFLADHWAQPHPPGTVDFLRHVQVRAKGYAADRTAVALWED